MQKIVDPVCRRQYEGDMPTIRSLDGAIDGGPETTFTGRRRGLNLQANLGCRPWRCAVKVIGELRQALGVRGARDLPRFTAANEA
jgi:hypothetical protein